MRNPSVYMPEADTPVDYSYITTRAIPRRLLAEIARGLEAHTVYVNQREQTWLTYTGDENRDGWIAAGWLLQIGDEAFPHLSGSGLRCKGIGGLMATPPYPPVDRPELFDVLWSCAQDAEAATHRQFPDWANDYGYDVDSIRARVLHEQYVANGERLCKLFTPETVQRITEVTL